MKMGISWIELLIYLSVWAWNKMWNGDGDGLQPVKKATATEIDKDDLIDVTSARIQWKLVGELNFNKNMKISFKWNKKKKNLEFLLFSIMNYNLK